MAEDTPRTYKVTQLGPPNERGSQVNIGVADLDSLVTHHPKSNRDAAMIDGEIVGVEKPANRSHAYIDGEFQEIEMRRTDEYQALKQDQVLLIKDFILEDEVIPDGQRTRAVDVPAPVAGYVSRRDDKNALVEISDKPGGDIIARVRHMGPIAVNEGDTISYGQLLGTQNELGLKPGAGKHVHLEMDTRYYQQYENYVSDLTSGRLPVQAEHRVNVQPQPVVDDGVIRLGESSERVKDLQRVLSNEGYRAAGDKALDQDGVYRLGMQGAVLDFQRTHGLPQTGDIDAATLNFAPPERTQSRETDRQDHMAPGRTIPATPESQAPTAPGHPDHPDHRPGLPDPLPPPVNQHRRRSPADPEHQDHAMLEQIRAGVRKIDDGLGKPYDDMSERISRGLLAACKDNREMYPDKSDYSLSGNVLNRVDHVILGKNGNIFAVQGNTNDPGDPANKRACAPVEQLARTPVEQSDEKLQAANQALMQERALTQQQELARGQNEPTRSSPVMA
jgi:hypothetical protein